jgi:hypothetical protein
MNDFGSESGYAGMPLAINSAQVRATPGQAQPLPQGRHSRCPGCGVAADLCRQQRAAHCTSPGQHVACQWNSRAAPHPRPLRVTGLQYTGPSVCGLCVQFRGVGGGSGGSPVAGAWQRGFICDQW